MRIVHTEASCGWGGQEIRIIEESLGMMERGHGVSILCPPESRIFHEAPRRGVPVVALPIARKRLQGLVALKHWLAINPVSLINTHSSTDSWLAALALAVSRRRPPIVRTRHISAPVSGNAATRWLYTRATTHIVTTGEALRQELIERNGYPAAHITSVPTGIDTRRFAPGDKRQARARLQLDPDRHYFGILATLRSWKGHLYLLDAFARSRQPNWTLLIVGEGPMGDNIRRRVEELNLGDSVTLVGQQSNPEDWLRALDVFCLPSYANEGVPQAILQAMLTGLPIVATTVGAIPEAITNDQTGVLIAPRDVDALAGALAAMAADPQKAAGLGRVASEVARERFSRDVMLDRMERIFQSVVREAG